MSDKSTETRQQESIGRYADDKDTQAVRTAVDLRSIWANKDQTYETHDGRVVSYSIAMLESVLGDPFAGSPKQEQSAFLAYCIANKLDPLRKQVHFIKYGQTPAAYVTSWEVFLERAQLHPKFDGFENGIMWRVQGIPVRGGPVDYQQDADHVIIGGWCEVWRTDQSHQREVVVPLSEMIGLKRDGSPTKSWAKQLTTMAIKTPTCRALRQAFPEDLQGLYSESETDRFAADMASQPKDFASGDTVPPTDLDQVAVDDEVFPVCEPEPEPTK